MWGDKMLKKMFVIFIIIVMLFFNSVCFATDYDINSQDENADAGIMPFSTIDRSEVDDDANITIDYTYHGATQIYKGSLVVPNSIATLDSYCIFINQSGIPYIYTGTGAYDCYYLWRPVNYTASSFVYVGNSSGTLITSYKYYVYNEGSWSSGTQSFSSHSSSSNSILGVSPSGFLFSHNANVFYRKSEGSGIRYNTGSVTPSSFNEIHACLFYGTSPKLITLSDTTYKVALGTCCGDYTYDGGDNFVSVTNTICKSLYIYIYDVDKSTDVYKYYFSYSDAIKEYITWEDGTGYVLELPFDKAFLPDFFENGHYYSFAFSTSCVHTVKPPNSSVTYEYFDSASFSADLTSYGSGASIEGDKNDDMQQAVTDAINKNNQAIVDASNKQTEAIEKQHETSKSIWETIKEILSYLNPFSENFFAYKLVELIFDGIKSLLIPEDGFFGDFFDNLYKWFNEKLGFLFYPFELIIEILERIADINFSNPIFNIPNI